MFKWTTIKNKIVFFFSYETNTGIKRSESAQVKNLQAPVVVYTGSYSYTNPDGGQVFVEYVADEKGYVPHVRIVGSGAKKHEEGGIIGYPAAGGALIASLVGWAKPKEKTVYYFLCVYSCKVLLLIFATRILFLKHV